MLFFSSDCSSHLSFCLVFFDFNFLAVFVFMFVVGVEDCPFGFRMTW